MANEDIIKFCKCISEVNEAKDNFDKSVLYLSNIRKSMLPEAREPSQLELELHEKKKLILKDKCYDFNKSFSILVEKKINNYLEIKR